jgi:branched-chain amino acid aminotransferase
MSDRVTYLSGKWVHETEARVSIFDSALMFGDMAFEMTRTFNQVPFHLEDHLDRLYDSLDLLKIDCGLSREELKQRTLETLQRNLPSEGPEMDWWLMHNISRGPLPVYEKAFPDGMQPTVTISAWPLVTHTGSFAPTYDTGIRLVVPEQQAIPEDLLDVKAKTRSRQHYRIAQNQVEARGQGLWALLVDPDGFVTEGTGCNVFAVHDGVLSTPEPRNILKGVSRKVTLRLATELGIETRETNLTVDDLRAADEIFCTASSFCLVHATAFEDREFNPTPGPIFKQLMQAWKDYAGLDFVQQAHDYHAALDAWKKT